MKKDDGARYFGPFAHSGALRTTLNWLNKKYGLRVCRPMRPDADDYKHCSNDVIKNCSAPCIGRVSEEEYRQRMEQACGYLEGKGLRDLKAMLEEEMQRAAAKLDFEKAAELRDLAGDLEKTFKPDAQLRARRPRQSRVHPQPDGRRARAAGGTRAGASRRW
jgi:excinuclease ABC subunit C